MIDISFLIVLTTSIISYILIKLDVHKRKVIKKVSEISNSHKINENDYFGLYDNNLDDSISNSSQDKKDHIEKPKKESIYSNFSIRISEIENESENIVQSEFKIIFLIAFILSLIGISISEIKYHIENSELNNRSNIINTNSSFLYNSSSNNATIDDTNNENISSNSFLKYVFKMKYLDFFGFLLGVFMFYLLSKLILSLSCKKIKSFLENSLYNQDNSLNENLLSYSIDVYFYIYTTIIVTFYTLINILYLINDDKSQNSEIICFFSLGTCFSTFFIRISGGIFTKGADIACDIFGKDKFTHENHSFNPTSLADNIGDLVGDLIGSLSDLGSGIIETISIFIFIFSTNIDSNYHLIELVMIILSINGLLYIIIEYIFQNYISDNEDFDENQILIKNEKNIILRFIVSTISIIILLLLIWIIVSFDVIDLYSIQSLNLVFLNIFIGIVSSFFITISTFYYTSKNFSSVQNLNSLAHISSGVNIIYGLATGYFSTIFPIFTISLSLLVSHLTLGLYGMSLLSIGSLLILPCIYQYQIYGPLADVSLGIANGLCFKTEVTSKINNLDLIGNTLSAMVKGYSTGSAGFLSFSIFYAITQKANTFIIDICKIESMIFLFLGSLYCLFIVSLCMRATSANAVKLIKDSNLQLRISKSNQIISKPDYFEFIQVSAEFSLRKSTEILLFSIVILICIFLFTDSINILPFITGIIICGIPLSISNVNSGSAWDNSKKCIENFYDLQLKSFIKSNSNDEKIRNINIKRKSSIVNANISDNLGDALKDISGPSTIVLIKFSSFFCFIIYSMIYSF